MANYTAKYINETFTLADGDTLFIDIKTPFRVMVAALTTDVTVGVEVIKDSGNFRAISPDVTIDATLISSDIWPPLTRFNFTGGGSEIRIYGV